MNYAKKMDNWGILRTPRDFVNRFGPNGLPISPINLSRTGLTIHWFMDFLTEKEGTTDEYESSGRVYHAYRDTEGVSIKDTSVPTAL